MSVECASGADAVLGYTLGTQCVEGCFSVQMRGCAQNPSLAEPPNKVQRGVQLEAAALIASTSKRSHAS